MTNICKIRSFHYKALRAKQAPKSTYKGEKRWRWLLKRARRTRDILTSMPGHLSNAVTLYNKQTYYNTQCKTVNKRGEHGNKIESQSQ